MDGGKLETERVNHKKIHICYSGDRAEYLRQVEIRS